MVGTRFFQMQPRRQQDMHTTILDFVTAAIGGEQVKRPLMAEDKNPGHPGRQCLLGKALSPAQPPAVACPVKKHRLGPQK